MNSDLSVGVPQKSNKAVFHDSDEEKFLNDKDFDEAIFDIDN